MSSVVIIQKSKTCREIMITAREKKPSMNHFEKTGIRMKLKSMQINFLFLISS